MENEIRTLQHLWVSKFTMESDKEIRDSIDLAIECMLFTDEVLGILGTFGLHDIYVRKEILDYLFKHKNKYKRLCMLWDQIVGNFS